MIEVMKASHQEVDVVDMSGVREEMRRMGGGGGGGGGGGAPTTEEVDKYMEKKFVEGTTKGLAMKVKAKKKC